MLYSGNELREGNSFRLSQLISAGASLPTEISSLNPRELIALTSLSHLKRASQARFLCLGKCSESKRACSALS